MSEILYQGDKAIIPYPPCFPLQCKPCQLQIKETSFKRDILRHSRTCRGLPRKTTINDVLFAYEICHHQSADRRIANKYQALHFGDSQLELRNYPCTQCNRIFGTQKALSSHTRQCPNAKSNGEKRVEKVVLNNPTEVNSIARVCPPRPVTQNTVASPVQQLNTNTEPTIICSEQFSIDYSALKQVLRIQAVVIVEITITYSSQS